MDVVGDDEAGQKTSGCDPEQVPAGVGPGEVSLEDGSQGKLEGNKSGRIVDQAFTGQNIDQALGKGNSADESTQGNGVCRRQDGSQDKSGCQGNGGNHPVDKKSGRGHGGKNKSEPKKNDAVEVFSEFPLGNQPRVGKEKRRDKKRKKRAGIQVKMMKRRGET